jgi:hypothetical protein
MVRRVHRRRAFRRVHGPEALRAFWHSGRAAAGRPQGSDFFRAWRAFGEQERRFVKIGRFSAAGHARNTMYFGPSVLSCISVFLTVKKR